MGPAGEPGDDGGVNYAITSDISGLPWAIDGQTASEKVTLEWLGILQEFNPSLASELTQMPFLQDHTPGDRQAIQTLTFISENSPRYAASIANHTGFADDGGIDNAEAKIIAVMGIPYNDDNIVLIDRLADFGTVEERSAIGRYGNPIDFAIVRWPFTRQNSALMETALTAVSDAETLMGQALPTDFVGILVDDLANAVGANNGLSIQVDEGFDFSFIGYSARYRQRVIAHEIGHYWWGHGRDAWYENWIAEGAAEYIGAYSVRSQFNDNGIYTNFYPCPYYRTIEHLRADEPQYGSYGSQCNYSLGERLFINLDRSMTTSAFNAAFRDLYRRVSTYVDGDQGLSLVRAFCPQCRQQYGRYFQRNLGNIGNTMARRYGEKVFTNRSAATGALPGLGQAQTVLIQDYSGENRQYGVAQVPASSPDQRRWVRLSFDDVTNPPDTASIIVEQYYEHREAWGVWRQEREVFSRDGRAWFYVYLGEPERRAVGHHWVYIYNEQDQKIAEIEYQVLP